MELTLGSKAPDIITKDDEGNDFLLTSLLGQWIVLYFYPKDNTSGCTAEACDFRDKMDGISVHGAHVVGVSPDNVASHQKFKRKYNLNFKLLADEDKKICNDYGVYGIKSLYGKKYMGVYRTTFIIDDLGNINHIFENVRVKGHIDEIIKYLLEHINK